MTNRKYGISKEYCEKVTSKLLDDYLKTEEGQKELEDIQKEFRDFVVFGIEPKRINLEIAKELKQWTLKNNSTK